MPRVVSILIRLLIVLGIMMVLAAVLLPEINCVHDAPTRLQDVLQLRRHYTWLELYRQQAKDLPADGGHEFVLTPWTSNVVAHTPENFDYYFVPGTRENDPVWRRKRRELATGTDPWPKIGDCSSADTNYAGRAREHLHDAGVVGEAIMADDNEGRWSHRDGTVNVLLSDGNVRTLRYAAMQERYGLGPLDESKPVRTFGPTSPIPECRKLTN